MGTYRRVVYEKQGIDIPETRRWWKIKHDLDILETKVNTGKELLLFKEQNETMYTVKKAWNYLEKFKNLKKSNDLHNPSYIAAMQVCLRFFKCYDWPINGKWISTRLALKRFWDKYARFWKVKWIYSSETLKTLEKVLKANEKKLNEDYQGQEEINPKKSSSSEKSTSSNSQKQNSSSSSSSSSSTSSSSNSWSSPSSSSSSSWGSSSSNSSSSSSSQSWNSSTSSSSSSNNSSNTPSNKTSTSSTSTSQQTERTVDQTAVVDKWQQIPENKRSANTSEVLTAETIQKLKNNLENTLKNINGILTDCKSKLGNLESTITNLKSSSEDQKQQVEDKKEKFRQKKTALENKINDLQQQQKELENRLSSLSSSNEKSDFDTLKGKLATLTTDVNALPQEVTTFSNDISTYETSLSPDNGERLKYNVKTFTLDEDFYGGPLFMSWVGKNFWAFLWEGQWKSIFTKWNPTLNYQGNIDTLRGKNLNVPLIADHLKDKLPATLAEYKSYSSHSNDEKVKNATDLLVMKVVDWKFVLCFYKDGNLAMATEVSPGRKDLWNTPSWVFSLWWKHADHKSSQYNQSPMPYAIHIQGAWKGGIYLHQGYSDGKPQSHGCIRVPGFYQWYLYDQIPLYSNIPIVIEDNTISANPSQTEDEKKAMEETRITTIQNKIKNMTDTLWKFSDANINSLLTKVGAITENSQLNQVNKLLNEVNSLLWLLSQNPSLLVQAGNLSTKYWAETDSRITISLWTLNIAKSKLTDDKLSDLKTTFESKKAGLEGVLRKIKDKQKKESENTSQPKVKIWGKEYDVKIERGDLWRFYNVWCSNWVPIIGYTWYPESKEHNLTSSEAYEYSILLIKHSPDMEVLRNLLSWYQKSWDDFKKKYHLENLNLSKKEDKKKWDSYLLRADCPLEWSAYVNAKIKENNISFKVLSQKDKNTLMDLAKSNVKNNNLSSLTLWEKDKLVHNLKWAWFWALYWNYTFDKSVLPEYVHVVNKKIWFWYQPEAGRYTFLWPNSQYFYVKKK